MIIFHLLSANICAKPLFLYIASLFSFFQMKRSKSSDNDAIRSKIPLSYVDTSKYKFDQLASSTELNQLQRYDALADVEANSEDVDLLRSIEHAGSYLGRRLTTNVSVPGNISNPRYRSFWTETLQCSDFVLQTISEGISL